MAPHQPILRIFLEQRYVERLGEEVDIDHDLGMFPGRRRLILEFPVERIERIEISIFTIYCVIVPLRIIRMQEPVVLLPILDAKILHPEPAQEDLERLVRHIPEFDCVHVRQRDHIRKAWSMRNEEKARNRMIFPLIGSAIKNFDVDGSLPVISSA